MVAGLDSCPSHLAPIAADGVRKEGGLPCVRHVAAQQPLVGIVLEACEVPGLLQARGSAEGPSQNGKSHVVALWRTTAARRGPGVGLFPWAELPLSCSVEGQLEPVSVGIIQRHVSDGGQLLASGLSYMMNDLCSPTTQCLARDTGTGSSMMENTSAVCKLQGRFGFSWWWIWTSQQNLKGKNRSPIPKTVLPVPELRRADVPACES